MKQSTASQKVYGYLRVSTDRQTNDNQKLAILNHVNHNKKLVAVDEWIEVKVSSRKSTTQRRIDELLERVSKGDVLIVSELSRLGRSVGQIIVIVDELIKNGVRVVTIKESIDINGKRNMQAKVMLTMFSLFAEIERDLISERTKEGLARARAQGKLLGRPKGTLGKSKLSGHEKDIQEYLKKGVNVTNLARIYGVSRQCMDNFVKTRGLAV